MSIAASSRGTDIGSLPNVLFPSTGSFRYASAASESDALPNSNRGGGEAGMPNLIIWGTDVNVEACKKQFIEFFKSPDFTVQQADMDEARVEFAAPNEPKPLYLNKLDEILHVPNEPYMTLNCAHLKQWNEQIYWQLVKYPTEMVQTLDMAANELFQELYPESAENIVISVRPFNIDQTYDITDINPSDIGRLITIRGMVTRTSTLIPEMIRGFFKCTSCLFTKEANVSMGRIEEPRVCPVCNNKFSFVLVHNRCRYIDRQVVKLQEAPDNMPAGRTPATIPLVACADLVDKVSPGDRVHVTGIYRGSQPRVIYHKRVSRSPCKVSIEVIHYRKMQSGKLYDESMELRLTPERIDKLKSLSQDENIYQKLANSLCPSIFGHLDVKKGVLLQLFGGTKKELPGHSGDPKLRHFRSEINVLLCGDPSTSKSQLLQYVHKLVPRGQYTSGKGSSAVGLTAYVTRDHDTNQLVLQTGALVMCDGGICCIDEFDKMTDSTRSVLHEVMEQQTLSIAKAGIVCQLNARTSVLAAANPEASAWNPQKNIRENVKLPETLLSRFDLIYLILDPFKEEYDKQLAEHLISLYYGDLLNDSDILPHDTVRDYLAYARTEVQPRLTQASVDQLIENYIKLRDHSNPNSSKKNRITAYPRNLESLIRLSEAHARMRFSPHVEAVDVCEAMRVTQEAMMHAVTDPTTGKINDELVMTM